MEMQCKQPSRIAHFCLYISFLGIFYFFLSLFLFPLRYSIWKIEIVFNWCLFALHILFSSDIGFAWRVGAWHPQQYRSMSALGNYMRLPQSIHLFKLLLSFNFNSIYLLEIALFSFRIGDWWYWLTDIHRLQTYSTTWMEMHTCLWYSFHVNSGSSIVYSEFNTLAHISKNRERVSRVRESETVFTL